MLRHSSMCSTQPCVSKRPTVNSQFKYSLLNLSIDILTYMHFYTTSTNVSLYVCNIDHSHCI